MVTTLKGAAPHFPPQGNSLTAEGTNSGFFPKYSKLAVCFSGAAIAAADLSLPANIDVGTFYFIPIVLSIWTKSIKWLWTSTVIFVFLTFIGIQFVPNGSVTGLDWLNRSMTAAALIVAAFAVHLRIHAVNNIEKTVAEKEKAKQALEESHALLDQRVQERTSKLAAAIQELQKENASRTTIEQQLRESESSLRELSTELLRAQDEERRRLGQELHDGLGQILAALKLCLHFLEGAIPPDDQAARQHLQECRNLANEAVSQVRTLSHLMYPPTLELVGLGSAVPWYIKGFEERSGIKTSLDMSPNFGRLPQELELALFRILQEALTNIHRHSGSQIARVSFQVTDRAAILQVEDDGKGIKDSGPGVGLRSMQERAKRLGGTLDVCSKLQGGVIVTATVPYWEASAAAS